MATLGDQSRWMAVSTVASLTIETDFAKATNVPVGPKSGDYGGPSGATGAVYTLGGPIRMSIGPFRQCETVAALGG